MGKTILVAGNAGGLGTALTHHFLNQGDRVAQVGTATTEPVLAPGAQHLELPWSRRSPIAAKNLLLTVARELGPLDEAWVVVGADPEPVPLADLAPLALDEALDSGMRGTLSLVRELLRERALRPALTLRFVFFAPDPPSLTPVAALQYQGQRGLVSALLRDARGPAANLWAYETLSDRTDEYLAFVTATKGPAPGRWNLFGERRNLLDNLFHRKEGS